MQNISDLEINLDGLEESLKAIEKQLRDIINNKSLSIEDIRNRAVLCQEAVNRYTGTANRNIGLLNEQAQFLLKKVQLIQESHREILPDSGDNSDFDIN
jgi:conjugal transfer/entry exclusion protein